ncbi:hypothetical protein [Variovorax boronicumulans]|uniref:hypothetical protein n=1 Tax=Variovorax boronicumulans TaxID=436515 RepID=UPI0012E4FCB7|nr:hypothetical protein [Variovorax boronicumulans]GER21293.1 hypothetical protein VCH24_63400 [Variovorax boronicumulans]
MKARINLAIAVIAAIMAVTGCERLTEDPFDSSAAFAARHIQAARAKCEAAGVPELWACAEIGREKKEAWIAARTALDVYEAFRGSCYEIASAAKCEGLIEKALLKTPRPQRAAERPIGSTAL